MTTKSFAALGGMIMLTSAALADFHEWAPTPPMGWNSWDCFGCTLTEAQARAQAYYDGVYAQYAAWGVDFVKIDDISRPYTEAQLLEIEAIRKAIDRTGRPIVLSLSPGDTPVARGSHVSTQANMWRISDDFWARWKPLHGMFGRLHRWEPHRVPGSWPDADMLPFGIISFDKKCQFPECRIALLFEPFIPQVCKRASV